MPVSVLIPTLNEARIIADCLASVAWSDDVVVVDSNSQDETAEIARSQRARVVQFKWNKQFPKKKNWAIQKVDWKHEWLLILDADERITPELAREIQETVARPKVDGYFINRRFMFMGRWLKHCGYYPSWNLRLFQHRVGRYEKLHVGDTNSGDNEVHEHVVLNGRTGYLREDMLHFAYPDITTWIEKHNRYSNWEASVEVAGEARQGGDKALGRHAYQRRKLRELSRRLPFRPSLRFLYSYLWKRGFLDGYAGLTHCRLLALYEYLIVLKVKEMKLREVA